MIIKAHGQTPKVVQPGKQPLDLAPARLAAQLAAVLRRHSAVLLVGLDQLCATFLHRSFIQPVTFARVVPDQALQGFGDKSPPFLGGRIVPSTKQMFKSNRSGLGVLRRSFSRGVLFRLVYRTENVISFNTL